MKLDAEIVSERDKVIDYYYPPRNCDPKIILDVGYGDGKSCRAYAEKYPECEIHAIEFYPKESADLLYGTPYHNNINPYYFVKYDLDEIFNELNLYNVDFIKISTPGKEKDLINNFSYTWPKLTRFVSARLSPNYHYQDAKRDLRRLGFTTWATYDNMSYYVIGENGNV